ncbi:MAG: rod shape-determining protein RodA [Pseudomonadota bacterium]|jgi:rod shape determining protein RodA
METTQEIPRVRRKQLSASASLVRRLHLDGPLLSALGAVILFGLFILYSATGENFGQWLSQVARLVLALVAMVVLAQIPPVWLQRASPILYGIGLVLLLLVAVHGSVSNGAQRWLDLKVFRFQPSEIMKLAVPMMCAVFLQARPLPPSWKDIGVVLAIIMVPAALIAKQPDLGTALLVAASGILVLLLAGLSNFVIGLGIASIGAAVPVAWHFMHDYQKQRVLMFLDPAQDPLGAGYHSIQSQIAIGSGGLFGKGWMHGSQAQLEFLPERSTDFIFAVIGEELGLLGQGLLIVLYLAVIARSLFLSAAAQTTYARLVCGSFAMTFFVYAFVNTGMVSGIVPVVGVPLPLVSYGGTAMVTLLASFGILMSLNGHRKLVGS